MQTTQSVPWALTSDSSGGMLHHQVARARPGDVVVAVSFTPYAPVVSTVVSDLAKRGIEIIAITDSPLSPLAEPSTVCIEISEAREQTFRTLVAPLCLAQSLVVSLGQAIAETQ